MRRRNPPIPIEKRTPDAWMRDAYESYVSEVSTPAMAMSLELAVVLYDLCVALKPHHILDLGSGFSSFVLRAYQNAQVVSVDDDAAWLERTQLFLKSRGVDQQGLVHWEEFKDQRGMFDIVSHDLGRMPVRTQTLPHALGRISDRGLSVLDDLHKRPYARAVSRVTRKMGIELYQLKKATMDEFGRFAGLAVPSGFVSTQQR